MPVNRDYRDLFAALNGAGAEYLLVGGLAVAYHAAPRYTKDVDVFVQIGVEPNRIDVITSIDGVSFDEAWPNRARLQYGDQDVPVIGLAELIKNKAESAKNPTRLQDRLDLEMLKRFGSK